MFTVCLNFYGTRTYMVREYNTGKPIKYYIRQKKHDSYFLPASTMFKHSVLSKS